LADRARAVIGSVRLRITFVAALVVFVVLAATGVALVTAQRRLLTEHLEDALRQRADVVSALVSSGRAADAVTDDADEDLLAQVVGPTGDVVSASWQLEGRGPIATGVSDEPRRVATLTDEGGAFLLISRRVQAGGVVYTVHVAGGMDDISDSGNTLAAMLTIAVPTVAVLLAALIWLLVGRALRPVEAIRAEVADIGGTDLHRRVPLPSGHDEIARLARTMNAMLDRLEDASRRQQRFVADASHELRSPLTRIRSELEVDLAHPDTADLAATHRSVLDEATALSQLVDDLLQLARGDSGGTARREPVDLDDLVLREVRRLRAAGRVSVDATGVSAAQVHGDPEQLARAVRNLGENAARHASNAVTLSLAERNGSAVLSVADDGPGIPADQHERVFQRFARVDRARTADVGGAGLGLAITREIVRRHRGTIAIDGAHRRGTRVVVTLPTVSGQ